MSMSQGRESTKETQPEDTKAAAANQAQVPTKNPLELSEGSIIKGQEIGRGEHDVCLIFAGTLKKDDKTIPVEIHEYFLPGATEHFKLVTKGLPFINQAMKKEHVPICGIVSDKQWIVLERMEYTLKDRMSEVINARAPMDEVLRFRIIDEICRAEQARQQTPRNPETERDYHDTNCFFIPDFKMVMQNTKILAEQLLTLPPIIKIGIGGTEGKTPEARVRPEKGTYAFPPGFIKRDDLDAMLLKASSDKEKAELNARFEKGYDEAYVFRIGMLMYSIVMQKSWNTFTDKDQTRILSRQKPEDAQESIDIWLEKWTASPERGGPPILLVDLVQMACLSPNIYDRITIDVVTKVTRWLYMDAITRRLVEDQYDLVADFKSQSREQKKAIECKFEESGLRYRLIGLDNQQKTGFIEWGSLSKSLLNYKLEPMSSLIDRYGTIDKERARKGKIYLSPEGTYLLRDSEGILREGNFDTSLVTGDFDKKIMLKDTLINILKITAKAGHIKTNEIIDLSRHQKSLLPIILSDAKDYIRYHQSSSESENLLEIFGYEMPPPKPVPKTMFSTDKVAVEEYSSGKERPAVPMAQRYKAFIKFIVGSAKDVKPEEGVTALKKFLDYIGQTGIKTEKLKELVDQARGNAGLGELAKFQNEFERIINHEHSTEIIWGLKYPTYTHFPAIEFPAKLEAKQAPAPVPAPKQTEAGALLSPETTTGGTRDLKDSPGAPKDLKDSPEAPRDLKDSTAQQPPRAALPPTTSSLGLMATKQQSMLSPAQFYNVYNLALLNLIHAVSNPQNIKYPKMLENNLENNKALLTRAFQLLGKVTKESHSLSQGDIKDIKTMLSDWGIENDKFTQAFDQVEATLTAGPNYSR